MASWNETKRNTQITNTQPSKSVDAVQSTPLSDSFPSILVVFITRTKSSVYPLMKWIRVFQSDTCGQFWRKITKKITIVTRMAYFLDDFISYRGDFKNLLGVGDLIAVDPTIPLGNFEIRPWSSNKSFSLSAVITPRKNGPWLHVARLERAPLDSFKIKVYKQFQEIQ